VEYPSLLEARAARDAIVRSHGATVHVWLVDLNGDYAADVACWLSADEQDRAGRFVRPHDRQLYARSHAVLRALLARQARCAGDEIRYSLDSAGKPRLIDVPLHFSLSHGHDHAAIAISDDHAVGVDVESMRPIDGMADLARDCLSPAEYLDWSALANDQRTRAFLVAWTRKEAVLKAIGTGLLVPPASVDAGIATVASRVAVDRRTACVSTFAAPLFLASVAIVSDAAHSLSWTSVHWSDVLMEPLSSAIGNTVATIV
jgi:4'-phosphopantetheinyl transferase